MKTLEALEAGVVKARSYIHVPRNTGERLADVVANGMGSWKFIIIQSFIVVGWIGVNLVGFLAHWDPYPFILLNLLFSTQAAYASPLILMSQNRQAQKDRMRDDHEAEEVELLYQINQTQLEILRILRNEICPTDEAGAQAKKAAARVATQLPAATKPVGTLPRRRR